MATFQGEGRSVMLVLRPLPSEVTVLTVTRDMVLPTTITGSYPRPLWFDRSLDGRSFKSALGDSLFREQYLDAVASIIAEQEAAGLDIVTDGDSRFDLTVGGKSWFFYPIERLGGVCGHRDTSRGWMSRHGLRPGKILWGVQEAYQVRRADRDPPFWLQRWRIMPSAYALPPSLFELRRADRASADESAPITLRALLPRGRTTFQGDGRSVMLVLSRYGRRQRV